MALVEIEYDDLYARGANAGTVLKQLRDAGLEICYRDFMNVGQCNVLAVSERVASVIEEVNTDAQRFYGEISDRYAQRFNAKPIDPDEPP